MPRHEEMVEPDITINGTPLSFAQAMTVRVAMIQFGLWCESEKDALGKIGENYRARLTEIVLMMQPLNAPAPKGAA